MEATNIDSAEAVAPDASGTTVHCPRGLAELGFSVHRVGDVYDLDNDGQALSDEQLAKWFVAVPCDSPFVSAVCSIPPVETERDAWLAAERLFLVPF